MMPGGWSIDTLIVWGSADETGPNSAIVEQNMRYVQDIIGFLRHAAEAVDDRLGKCPAPSQFPAIAAVGCAFESGSRIGARSSCQRFEQLHSQSARANVAPKIRRRTA
jgi:hypothetical protein